MSDKQYKAMRIATYVRLKIWQCFRDDQFIAGFRLLDRYNMCHRIAFPNTPELSPGGMLDEYLEDCAFQSRF